MRSRIRQIGNTTAGRVGLTPTFIQWGTVTVQANQKFRKAISKHPVGIFFWGMRLKI